MIGQQQQLPTLKLPHKSMRKTDMDIGVLICFSVGTISIITKSNLGGKGFFDLQVPIPVYHWRKVNVGIHVMISCMYNK